MKVILIKLKILLSFVASIFFAVVACDWIVVGICKILGEPHSHSGIFFKEVWSAMGNIYTWCDWKIFRTILKILTIFLTLYIPIFLSTTTYFYTLWCRFLLRDSHNE